MNPPSDVTAMRTGRWPLADFRKGVNPLSSGIEHGAVWDFLSHPSALVLPTRDSRSSISIIDTVRRWSPRAPGPADTVAQLRGTHMKSIRTILSPLAQHLVSTAKAIR
jgi:hypothetical protein